MNSYFGNVSVQNLAHKLPSWDTSGCECKPARSVSATARNIRTMWRSHSKNVCQRDREADPARVVATAKGNSSIWLPPRRFAPPLLSQEGSLNFKLRHYPYFAAFETSS